MELGVLKIGTPICVYKEGEVNIDHKLEKWRQNGKIRSRVIHRAQPQEIDLSQEEKRIRGHLPRRGSQHHVRPPLRPQGHAGIDSNKKIYRLPEVALQTRSLN